MLKAYAFDIDSNLVYTDTKIVLEKKWENGLWTPIEVSQEEHGEYMKDREQYRYIDGIAEHSMTGFTLPGIFKKTFFDAIENKRFGPSYPKYIQAHMEASPICKLTARGHPVEEFRDVNKAFIYEVLTDCQRDELVYNMRQNLWASAPKRKDSLINAFLDNNYYCPCSNKDFVESIGMSFEHPTSEKKKIAFERFIPHIQRVFTGYFWERFVQERKISVGFSDDLKANILGMQKHIINELMHTFPEIKFSLYHTLNTNNIHKQIFKKNGDV